MAGKDGQHVTTERSCDTQTAQVDSKIYTQDTPCPRLAGKDGQHMTTEKLRDMQSIHVNSKIYTQDMTISRPNNNLHDLQLDKQWPQVAVDVAGIAQTQTQFELLWDCTTEKLENKVTQVPLNSNPNSSKFVDLAHEVIDKGYPNVWGAKIPLETRWNLTLFEGLLNGYHDVEVIQFLKYGWPVSRPPNWAEPEPTYLNHGGATKHPQEMCKYINKEVSHNAVAGPFEAVPFKSRIGVSPLSSRPKRDSEERRVIMDLSWPPGKSVNDGIAKDQFMGFHVKLQFPTLDVIAKRVHELGKVAYMFKVDLSRYFRQLNIDPGDYSLLCFTWGGESLV